MLSSPSFVDRTLTVTGKNLSGLGGRRLQFMDSVTGFRTIHFGSEVRWISDSERRVDMRSIRRFFPEHDRAVYRVRVTDAKYLPISDWSAQEVIIAVDEHNCAPSSPFPPTAPVRGIAADFWADVVLGQTDFTEITPNEVVPYKLFNPGGVAVDRSVSPGRAYVWDAGNSRILGIDLAKCYARAGACPADLVIGQPSASEASGCNRDGGFQSYPVLAKAGSETLCGLAQTTRNPILDRAFVTMAVNAEGDLFVPDSYNHRVLKFENPFETDTIADSVWGQTDFTASLCNEGSPSLPTARSLCFYGPTNRPGSGMFGAGVELDVDGNLWVADAGNNRVLRFPLDPRTGEISKTADIVLGQPDLTTRGHGIGLNELHTPSAVAVDAQGQIHVADSQNDRVLTFTLPSDSTRPAGKMFASRFLSPTSLQMDPKGRGVWVNDTGDNVIELWDPTGTTVLNVLGNIPDYLDDRCGSDFRWLPGSAAGCNMGGGLGFDSQGNVLAPAYHPNHDVFRFRAVGDQASSQPDWRLFHPVNDYNVMTKSSLRSPRGIAVWQDQLIVADTYRLLFWNGTDTLANGRPPDGLIGDESLTGLFPMCCARIKVDQAGHLWVASVHPTDYVDVYQLPLDRYSVPVHTIWTKGATFPVLGTDGHISLGDRIMGIAPLGAGEFLWLSDTTNHRVLRIRDPLTDPVVDVVLGQPDASRISCNRADNSKGGTAGFPYLDTLCFPATLSVDRLGNLYVSDDSVWDEGNRRLLVFSRELTPEENSVAIFAPSATKVLSGPETRKLGVVVPNFSYGTAIESNLDSIPLPVWEPAFDSDNRMVVGYDAFVAERSPRFVGVYLDPMGKETVPDHYLFDFVTTAYSATFDSDGDLYIGDLLRSRVLVYLDPFKRSTTLRVEPAASDAELIPEHEVTIESVGPAPPYCVIRVSTATYERTLNLDLSGLAEPRNLELDFRRVTSSRREIFNLEAQIFNLEAQYVHDDGSGISLDDSSLWKRLWPNHENVTLTVRIVTGGPEVRQPLSNWSPAFLLADSVESCGIASPPPPPTPTPVPAPTSYPEATIAPTVAPTPSATVAPTPTNTPVPTTAPTLTPTRRTEPRAAATPTRAPPTPRPVSTEVEGAPAPVGTNGGCSAPSQGARTGLWLGLLLAFSVTVPVARRIIKYQRNGDK